MVKIKFKKYWQPVSIQDLQTYGTRDKRKSEKVPEPDGIRYIRHSPFLTCYTHRVASEAKVEVAPSAQLFAKASRNSANSRFRCWFVSLRTLRVGTCELFASSLISMNVFRITSFGFAGWVSSDEST